MVLSVTIGRYNKLTYDGLYKFDTSTFIVSMFTLPNHLGSTSARHHQSLAAALSDARAAAERQTRLAEQVPRRRKGRGIAPKSSQS